MRRFGRKLEKVFVEDVHEKCPYPLESSKLPKEVGDDFVIENGEIVGRFPDDVVDDEDEGEFPDDVVDDEE